MSYPAYFKEYAAKHGVDIDNPLTDMNRVSALLKGYDYVDINRLITL